MISAWPMTVINGRSNSFCAKTVLADSAIAKSNNIFGHSFVIGTTNGMLSRVLRGVL